MEVRTTDSQELVQRLAALEKQGVVDVKFCLRNPTETTVEEAARELDEMLRALEVGETETVEPAPRKQIA